MREGKGSRGAIDRHAPHGTLPAMRSLPMMLASALALTTFAACDKPAEDPGKAEVAKADTAKTDAAKADAKKADEAAVAPEAAADPEEGCIHEGKHEPEGASCDHEGTVAPTESTGHFGAPFALTETQPLTTTLASGVPTEPVKVSGTVEAVCQSKGCWMVIKDGEMTARVLVKDHAFAIPMDGKGKAALVEGTLEAKELSEANVAHLKKDGDDTLEGDGPRKEYFLHATAVELAPNS